MPLRLDCSALAHSSQVDTEQPAGWEVLVPASITHVQAAWEQESISRQGQKQQT